MRGAISRTRSRTSGSVRLATGWAVSTNSNPGKPYAFAIASAGTRNASVQMLTVGTPLRSRMTPSARLAALHEPQSPIAAMAKLQVAKISSTCVRSTGVPK